MRLADAIIGCLTHLYQNPINYKHLDMLVDVPEDPEGWPTPLRWRQDGPVQRRSSDLEFPWDGRHETQGLIYDIQFTPIKLVPAYGGIPTPPHQPLDLF